MRIFGLEKLSLVDYGSYACAVVFTGGCNFRCPFCHNSGLVEQETNELLESEVLDFLRKRYGLLDAVVVSGGEPTMQADLPDFLAKIKDIGYKVKLDTNGTNPDMLNYVIHKGLVDYVAMDIKNSFENYPKTTGLKNLNTDNIKHSLEILNSSNIDYELRTTIVKELHQSDDIKAMAKELKGAKKLYLQQFVDTDSCINRGLNPVSKEIASEWKEILSTTIDSVELRGYV